jgi:hypothetical protein
LLSAAHVKRVAAKVRKNALNSSRFSCEVCDIPLQSQHALNKHLASTVHSDKVAGIQRSELSQYALNRKAARAATKAAGEF